MRNLDSSEQALKICEPKDKLKFLSLISFSKDTTKLVLQRFWGDQVSVI